MIFLCLLCGISYLGAREIALASASQCLTGYERARIVKRDIGSGIYKMYRKDRTTGPYRFQKSSGTFAKHYARLVGNGNKRLRTNVSSGMKRKPHFGLEPADNKLYRANNQQWYIRDSRGVHRVVYRGDGRGEAKYQTLYARCDNGKWYKFVKPPETFLGYYYNLTVKSNSNERNEWLQQSADGKDWYIRTGEGLSKICSRVEGQAREKGAVFAEAQDGIWYKISKAPLVFKRFLATIRLEKPNFQERVSSTQRLVASDDGKQWSILCEDFFERFFVTAGRDDRADTLRLRANNKRWFRFINPPIGFVRWVYRKFNVPKQPSLKYNLTALEKYAYAKSYSSLTLTSDNSTSSSLEDSLVPQTDLTGSGSVDVDSAESYYRNEGRDEDADAANATKTATLLSVGQTKHDTASSAKRRPETKLRPSGDEEEINLNYTKPNFIISSRSNTAVLTRKSSKSKLLFKSRKPAAHSAANQEGNKVFGRDDLAVRTATLTNSVGEQINSTAKPKRKTKSKVKTTSECADLEADRAIPTKRPRRKSKANSTLSASRSSSAVRIVGKTRKRAMFSTESITDEAASTQSTVKKRKTAKRNGTTKQKLERFIRNSTTEEKLNPLSVGVTLKRKAKRLSLNSTSKRKARRLSIKDGPTKTKAS